MECSLVLTAGGREGELESARHLGRLRNGAALAPVEQALTYAAGTHYL